MGQNQAAIAAVAGRAMANFASAAAKLDRAVVHYQAFQSALNAYIASQPVSLVAKRNADGRSEDFYVSLSRQLPAELDTIFGDCVHNLRCVLDHIVTSLAVANRGDSNDRRTAFPICSTVADFQEQSKRPLRLLSDNARAFIESLQPYNRQGRPGTLLELKFLDDRDKHRSIIDHRLEVIAQLHYTTAGINIEYADPLRLADRAAYATVTYDMSYAGTKDVRPPIVATVVVQRSNLIGYLDAHAFLREEALPYVRGILNAATDQFL
jgi:hypothetical protein